MPKLRPINFAKIKNGNFDEAKRVMADLQMLTPRGPLQNQKGHDYVKFEKHPGKEAVLKAHPLYTEYEGASYHFGYNAGERQSAWWGYSDEQLYWTAKALGCSGTWLGESDFRQLLRKHFDMCHGAALTRRSRRLSNRLSGPWQRAIKGGKLGDLAWKCRIETPEIKSKYNGSYYGPTTQCALDISFAAKTQDEATMMLKTLFGHAVASTVSVNWEAWSAAEETTILSKNIEDLKELQSHRVKAEAQIAELQKYLENIDTLEEAVNMYALSICD
jgi:hypothetical protein